MAFMAEPAKAQRKSLGIWVLVFLGILLVLAKRLKQPTGKILNKINNERLQLNKQ